MKSKEQIANDKNAFWKLIEETKFWEEPLRGISTAKIVKTEELERETKRRMPSTCFVTCLPQTIRFVPGEDDIRFGDLHEKR